MYYMHECCYDGVGGAGVEFTYDPDIFLVSFDRCAAEGELMGCQIFLTFCCLHAVHDVSVYVILRYRGLDWR